jgi:hypothetical protein
MPGPWPVPQRRRDRLDLESREPASLLQAAAVEDEPLGAVTPGVEAGER